MISTTSVLVFGAGGLLGSAVLRELARRGVNAQGARVRWGSEDAASVGIVAAIEALAREDGELQYWWCAGAGVTATSDAELAAELRLLERFVEKVASVAEGRTSAVQVFFASSAGAVYAGSAEPPFSEATPPVPLGAYGWAKLEAERLVFGLSGLGVGVAIGRIANLYGAGQNLAKPQGLISQLCLAAQLRRPLNIYVSMDTLRDYLYVDDAAAHCVELMGVVANGEGSLVKIICSGQSVSIGALLGEANRVYRRRVPVVMAASPLAGQQARDLRLRSVVLPELGRGRNRTLATGMGQVRRALEGCARQSLPT